jgi:hypothetical protein
MTMITARMWIDHLLDDILCQVFLMKEIGDTIA